MKASNLASIRTIALEHNVDRFSAQRWLHEDGVKPNTSGKWPKYDCKAAAVCIEARKKAKAAGPDLTPRQRLDTAKAIAQEQANEEQNRTMSEDWISATAHHEILKAIVDQLDQLPGKVRGEFGLTDVQVKGLARAIDEVRTTAKTKLETKR